ncbi:MAG: acyl-CoA thioesterase [Nocardioidaceae bacterium]
MTSSPRVRIERTVEWPDTDAAGHYHHSAIIRWVEAAEAELHAELGMLDLFGVVPRVHYEVDYLARLWFRDVVSIELAVAELGTSSIRYTFTVRRGDELAAQGVMVAVHADPDTDGPTPWPANVRERLAPSR